MSNRTKGLLLVAFSALFWGTNGLFARMIDLPSPVLLFYRFLFGTVFLSVYLIYREKKIPFPQTRKKELLILGFLNAAVSAVAFYAFMNTTIANAEILLYAYPVYVLIMAPFIIGEKIDRKALLPLGMSFLGLILMAYSGQVFSSKQNIWGILAAFTAGLLFALYVLAAKKISGFFGGMHLTFFQLAATVVVLFPLLFLFQYQLTMEKMLLLCLMGFTNSTLAATFYFLGIKQVKAQYIGIISYLEPLSAVVYAMLLIGEIPGILTVLGGFFILWGGYSLLKVKN